MHIERIRFDEVFDVQAGRGDFSFRSGGRPRYGVKLPKRVIPAPGSTFALAFDEPGDWSSIIASRDLASIEVVLTRPTWSAVLGWVADYYLYFLPVCIATLVFGGPWAGLAAAVLFLLAVGYLVARGMRLNRAARQALLDIEENGIPGDNGGSPLPGSVV